MRLFLEKPTALGIVALSIIPTSLVVAIASFRFTIGHDPQWLNVALPVFLWSYRIAIPLAVAVDFFRWWRTGTLRERLRENRWILLLTAIWAAVTVTSHSFFPHK